MYNKKLVSFLATLIAMVVCVGNAFGDLNSPYKEQRMELNDALDHREYEKALDLLNEYRIEFPDIITDEAYEEATSTIFSVQETLGELDSEFDPFENKYLLYFPGHKTPNKDDCCIVRSLGDKCGIYFYVVMDKRYLNAKDFVLLLNDNIRIKNDLKNRDMDHEDNVMFETFYIDMYDVKFSVDRDTQITKAAVRFYGNEERTMDYTFTDEQVSMLNKMLHLTLDLDYLGHFPFETFK